MTVIARDNSATDHLVYAWPLPIGPECEVACSEEEQVVMCPAWMVGDRLGPGRHRWRTPDPTRPVSAFFVLTSPVDVSFDMVTGFVIPQTGQPVRLRATGSLQVRCADPGLLIAQFVGLPFDMVNDGVLRSVRRSVERMLARLLTRRVVMAGTPAAVTESAALQQIVEELVAYNPTAGAVFGVELIRMGYCAIGADDGTGGPLEIPAPPANGANGHASQSHIPSPREKPTDRSPAQGPLAAVPAAEPAPPGSPNKFKRPPTPRLDQQPGVSPSQMAAQAQSSSAAKEFTSTAQEELVNKRPDFSLKDGATVRGVSPFAAKTDGEETTTPAPAKRPPTTPPIEVRSSSQGAQTSGEIGAKARGSSSDVSGEIRSGEIRSGEIRSGEINKPKPPRPTLEGVTAPAGNSPRRAAPMIVPSTDEEITEPAPSPPTPPPSGVAAKADVAQRTSTPTTRGAAPLAAEAAAAVAASNAKAQSNTPSPTQAPEPPRSVLGIGMGAIGVEPPKAAASSKVPVGGRVLVPGPNGLMQSATVRQLLQGYYEIEIGSTGQTVWVPVAGVVPD